MKTKYFRAAAVVAVMALFWCAPLWSQSKGEHALKPFAVIQGPVVEDEFIAAGDPSSPSAPELLVLCLVFLACGMVIWSLYRRDAAELRPQNRPAKLFTVERGERIDIAVGQAHLDEADYFAHR